MNTEPVGSPVKVVKVCFACVVKPFTGEVVKVCSGPKITKDTTSDHSRDFFSERILKYWIILPKNVKMSESVNSFKANLENYKVRSLANVYSTGHFWEVSGHIMDIGQD